MWPHTSNLGMPSPGGSRPWTPPDAEDDASPRSDYFSDSFRGPLDDGKNWLQGQKRDQPARCDTPTDHGARPQLPSRLTDPAPYTPTKTFSLQNRDANGAPQYPYTPDSSRILRRSTELPGSPSPWGDGMSTDDDGDEDEDEDEDELSVSSPVQDALSSCIAHFKDLIQTRQPDEDQMEYIVGQFEAMATYLSAPTTQSRHSDEHLFDEQDTDGLGISKLHPQHNTPTDTTTDPQSPYVNPAYVAQVSAYIAAVQTHIEDLKLRLDEVKTLNGIQLDVIADLRRQMRLVRQGMGRGLGSVADSADVHHFLDEEEEDEDGYEDVDDEDEDADKAGDFAPESEDTLDPVPAHADPGPRREAKHALPSPCQDHLSNKISTRRIVTIIHHPPQRSFWSSFGDALDGMAGLWLEH